MNSFSGEEANEKRAFCIRFLLPPSPPEINCGRNWNSGTEVNYLKFLVRMSTFTANSKFAHAQYVARLPPAGAHGPVNIKVDYAYNTVRIRIPLRPIIVEFAYDKNLYAIKHLNKY